jgi:hypothetical protein
MTNSRLRALLAVALFPAYLAAAALLLIFRLLFIAAYFIAPSTAALPTEFIENTMEFPWIERYRKWWN